ncbi:hypothetical protein Sjap_016454 [Stephania japonica]|uniref:Uncharacterized protein n=1 Tax=Stephania japonica TaxID=461633 RepID=A0AAP0ILC6_9MAGN
MEALTSSNLVYLLESKGQHHNVVSSSSFSPSLIDLSVADKIASGSEKEDTDSKPRVGLFGRIKLWFGSWRTGKSCDTLVGKCEKGSDLQPNKAVGLSGSLGVDDLSKTNLNSTALVSV